jgi:hypothetical protein
MAEQELFSEHKSEGQKPKTMAEHRAEFTQTYESWRAKDKELEASWTNEDGQERIGKVYRFTSNPSYPRTAADRMADRMSAFVLKARQAGFTMLDKTEIPFTSGSTLYQFTLEGKPLPPPIQEQ